MARVMTPRRARHWMHRRTGTRNWNIHADYRPARWPPDGFVTGAPGFIGVGGQRCGSTWWFTSICRHPDVYHHPDLGKEIRYLVRFHDHEPDAQQVAEYAAWFPRPADRPDVQVGEWTPYYMAYPWIPPAITTVAPGAKVIASLRDPVERFCSGLALQRVHGRRSEVATLRQIGLGFYGHQVANLMQTIPARDLLVLQYEQCREDPVGQLARTYEFLGLEPFAVPEAELRQPAGRVFTEKPGLSADRRKLLVEAYAPDVEQVFSMLGSFDRSLWTNFT
jgi:hypothetical protein